MTHSDELPLLFDAGAWRTHGSITSKARRWLTPVALAGSFELTCAVDTTRGCRITIMFAGSDDLSSCYAWLLRDGEILLVQRSDGTEKQIQKRPLAHLPSRLRMVRTGAFCTLFVNGAPSAWAWLVADLHPRAGAGRAAIQVDAGALIDARIESFEFGSRGLHPVLEPRMEPSWMSGQTIPGSILEVNGTYYLYFIGVDGRAPGSESGGQARMGVATSSDLLRWDVHETPLLESSGPARSYLREEEMTADDIRKPRPGDGAWDGLYLFANGSVRAPDGRIVVMYSGFDGRWWRGLGCASAPGPLGRFEPFPGNPVFLLGAGGSWDHGAMHEFDLVADDGRYLLFYAGFDGKGDRGGIATSSDLIHWDRSAEPCFGPEAPDWWDSMHVRPRSLTRIDGTWYLFYEGANSYKGIDKGKDVWTDSIGLARSRDLKSWEYHPRNPVISQSTSVSAIDSRWTGWPRMVIRDGLCYVFHAVRDLSVVRTALRILPLGELVRW